MKWIGKEQEDIFESLDADLDRVKNNQKDWLVNLQTLREKIDSAYNEALIAEYQWRVLVNKSARIQDTINGGK